MNRFLEPGPGRGRYKKDTLTADDLCAFMVEVKAIEAHQAAKQQAAPEPQAATPVPVVEGSAEQRQARRWQMCIDKGLTMPTDTYAQLPRGIKEIAKAENITRQALAQDLNAHRERLFGK